MPTLSLTDDNVAVVHLGDAENRLNRDWIDELGGCLDRVEAAQPHAVVTTATGKTAKTTTGVRRRSAARTPPSLGVGAIAAIFAVAHAIRVWTFG